MKELTKDERKARQEFWQHQSDVQLDSAKEAFANRGENPTAESLMVMFVDLATALCYNKLAKASVLDQTPDSAHYEELMLRLNRGLTFLTEGDFYLAAMPETVPEDWE